ncbi:hypothetical protein JCM17823_22080 [Halorubrum gandharaense]
MNVPLGLHPFANQSRAEHAAVAVGGVLACLVGYVGGAVLLYDLSALDHGAPAGPRRVATVFASLACWGYYTLAFIRGKGGPVTNVLAYPFLTVTLVPFLLRWTVFGPNWEGARSRVGFFLPDLGMAVDAALAVVPGLTLCVTLITIWASVLGAEGARKWQEKYLSPAFREAFVEETDFE